LVFLLTISYPSSVMILWFISCFGAIEGQILLENFVSGRLRKRRLGKLLAADLKHRLFDSRFLVLIRCLLDRGTHSSITRVSLSCTIFLLHSLDS
jgi:hypothetical protein